MTYEQLRLRSLDIIISNQHPSGAYLACPTMPDYQFSWFRDGAFIAYALTIDGQRAGLDFGGSMAAQWESAGRFHDWCATVITDRAEAIERGIQRGQQGEPPRRDEIINARYTAEGTSGPDDWPEFQLDGPGMWLWSLAHYVRAARIAPLPERWLQAVDLAARYLSAHWRTPCFDCWEERGDDIHPATLGALYAGLLAADNLLETKAFAETAQRIKTLICREGLTPGGEIAKSFGLDMVDASLISLATPYRMFEPHDPIMQRTIARIERDLHAKGSGVHRYREDVYYGGGAWVLLGLWLAWHYAEAGQKARAWPLFEWAAQQADTAGNLPEQVTSPMLFADHYAPWVAQRGRIANPLLWSHAKYLIVYNALHPVTG